MKIRHDNRSPRPRGVALVKVLMCLAVLVGMAALNVDGGRAMDERAKARAAADAAALAAGGELYKGWWAHKGADPFGTARAAAVSAAAANGYPEDCVTVAIPPTTGAFAGRAGHVEVTITCRVAHTFGRAVSGSDIGVAGRAVARGEPLPIGIILLNEHAAASFNNTAAAFALVNKPIIVNSDHAGAFRSRGLVMANLSRIDVTGGTDIANLLSVTTRVRTGVRPTLDPLAFLPVPDAGAMPVRAATPTVLNSLLPVILQPGVYRGGVRVTGATVVVMTPGVYVMEGGGFRVDGLATVTGLGTMVYNATSPTYPAGPISVTGLGKVVMTAPLSGTYQGINFFQHRGLTQPVSLTGTGLTTITGVVYAARAPVALTGLVAVGLDILGGAYVADTMTVTGVGAVTVDLGLNRPRVPDVRVVE